MKVEQNKVVVLTYELTVDGKVADSATEERPLDYIHGTHMLIPKFEQNLEGKEPGDGFAFTIEAAEGYGEYDDKLKFDVPKTAFEVDGKLMEELLEVGRIVPLLNSAGQVCQATVVEVKDEAVTLDFNHPMAGKTLNFAGKVISVREATEKELTQGLHGEFLPQEECSCGCHGHHHHDGECGCGCEDEGECDCDGDHEGHCCGKGEGHCHNK